MTLRLAMTCLALGWLWQAGHAHAQECPLGPADSVPNAGFGPTVAHWPWPPAIIESAARAVFRDLDYTIATSDAAHFTTRVSRRRPDDPMLATFADGPHPGVVLTLEIEPAGNSASTRLTAVAQCGLDYPPEQRAEDSYEFILADEFMNHLIAEATLRGTPGGTGYHVLGPFEGERHGPERWSCPIPRYPSRLSRDRIEGSARIAFVVGTSGEVEQGSVEVLEATNPEFGEAGAEMIRGCRFKPAEVDGSPVRARTVMPIVFNMQDPSEPPPFLRPAPKREEIPIEQALEDVACLSPEALTRDTLSFGIPSGVGGGYTSVLWLWQQDASVVGWIVDGDRGFQGDGALLREAALDATRTVLTAAYPSTDGAQEAQLKLRVSCSILWGTVQHPWGATEVRFERVEWE
jgi:TonB family protein